MEKLDETDTFIDADSLGNIRKSADWNRTCTALDLRFCSRRSKAKDWWGHSPFGEDRTPSFHVMPEKGVWYCFSTKQGGGIIELVQALKGMNCFEAGEWLLNQGLCQTPNASNGNSERKHRSLRKIEKATSNTQHDASQQLSLGNKPIRQSLVQSLEQDARHPLLKERGISQSTCEYLGCGYLPKTKSSLSERIVFQIKGIEETAAGPKPVMLGHIGRATTDQQTKEDGKWLTYAGFQKRFELYNIDNLLTDPEAIAQVQLTGHVLIVEGPFDVAKCIEAGIKNVVAALGSDLHEDVLPKLAMIQKYANPKSFLIWFDRDEAGKGGQSKTISAIASSGYIARGFDWEQIFGLHKIRIPDTFVDPCDMSCYQINWLRNRSKL